MTVVVVDDDPDLRALVAMKLSKARYVVMVESDGRAGLATALAEQPALGARPLSPFTELTRPSSNS